MTEKERLEVKLETINEMMKEVLHEDVDIMYQSLGWYIDNLLIANTLADTDYNNLVESFADREECHPLLKVYLESDRDEEY